MMIAWWGSIHRQYFFSMAKYQENQLTQSSSSSTTKLFLVGDCPGVSGQVRMHQECLVLPRCCQRCRIRWDKPWTWWEWWQCSNECARSRWRARRPSGWAGWDGTHRAWSETPERQQWQLDRWEMKLDGWHSEWRTLQLETSWNTTTSWIPGKLAWTVWAQHKRHTWTIHTSSLLSQMTSHPSEPTTTPRKNKNVTWKCQHHQMDLPSHPDMSRPIERLKQIGHNIYGPETVQEQFQAAKHEDKAAGVDRGRAHSRWWRTMFIRLSSLGQVRTMYNGNILVY